MAITKTDVYDVQVGKSLDLRLTKTDTGARNNIPMVIRYAGMIVYTVSENSYWMWPSTGATNADWVQLDWLGGVTPKVWYEDEPPTSAVGNDGDIYYYDTATSVAIYQKVAGDWNTPLGTIQKGSTYTFDARIEYGTTTSLWLDSEYPDSKAGDVVYSNDVSCTKYAAGKWRIDNVEFI